MDASFLQGRMQVLYEHKNYAEAIAHADQLLGQQPKNAMAWYIKGLSLVAIERHHDALHCFEQLALYESKNVIAYYMQIECAMKLNLSEKIEPLYDTIIALDPRDIRALKEKTKLLFRKSEYHDALQYCYRVLEQVDDVEMEQLKEKIVKNNL